MIQSQGISFSSSSERSSQWNFSHAKHKFSISRFLMKHISWKSRMGRASWHRNLNLACLRFDDSNLSPEHTTAIIDIDRIGRKRNAWTTGRWCEHLLIFSEFVIRNTGHGFDILSIVINKNLCSWWAISCSWRRIVDCNLFFALDRVFLRNGLLRIDGIISCSKLEPILRDICDSLFALANHSCAIIARFRKFHRVADPGISSLRESIRFDYPDLNYSCQGRFISFQHLSSLWWEISSIAEFLSWAHQWDFKRCRAIEIDISHRNAV
jgi:hypothetical protein